MEITKPPNGWKLLKHRDKVPLGEFVYWSDVARSWIFGVNKTHNARAAQHFPIALKDLTYQREW